MIFLTLVGVDKQKSGKAQLSHREMLAKACAGSSTFGGAASSSSLLLLLFVIIVIIYCCFVINIKFLQCHYTCDINIFMSAFPNHDKKEAVHIDFK